MEIQRLKKRILKEERRRRKSKTSLRGRLIFGLVLILCIAIVGGIFYQRNLDEILERQFTRAEALLERGEYSRAYAKFNSIYEHHPEFRRSPEALFLAGEILHLYLDRENEALLAFLLVERDYPDREESYRAQYRSAEIFKYRLKDFDRALPVFQKLLENGLADGPRVQYEIADTYFRQNKLEQARIEFEYLVKTYPQTPLLPEVLFRIGATFALEGNYRDAEFIYRKITTEYPGSPFSIESQLSLASVLERKGELRAALNLLEELREQYEKPGIIDKKIAQIRERIKQKKNAI
jgi:TolA-binding protein